MNIIKLARFALCAPFLASAVVAGFLAMCCMVAAEFVAGERIQ